MTCAVGLKANGRVYLGVDSACTSNLIQITARSSGKLFRLGPLLIASSGSRRAPQIIQHCLSESFTGIERSPYEWLVKRLTVTLRRALTEHGSLEKYADGGADKQDLTMLIAYRNRLFELHEDFQVDEWREPYCAIGAGDQLALGAFFATKDLDPMARVRMALCAAAKFQGNVRPPFLIEATEPKRARHSRPQLVASTNRKAG